MVRRVGMERAMTFAERWRSLSAAEIRAHAAEAREDAALDEAAARAALSLRHGSASPAMIALIVRLVEIGVLALALWGASRAFAPLVGAGLGASLAAAAL
ncbi:MAG: hypothetical protein CVT86_07835, partial [Alphaproteobacteria bacterium HGW-Alphaproteobacteria-8]